MNDGADGSDNEDGNGRGQLPDHGYWKQNVGGHVPNHRHEGGGGHRILGCSCLIRGIGEQNQRGRGRGSIMVWGIIIVLIFIF